MDRALSKEGSRVLRMMDDIMLGRQAAMLVWRQKEAPEDSIRVRHKMRPRRENLGR